MAALNEKANRYFPGKVVRKDLTKMIKEGANVPVYVLEYLLGMYCATDDEEQIREGVQKVKEILSKNYVRPDEAELIKARIKERGRYKVIDKLTVKLNEKLDRYEAEFSNLGLKGIAIGEGYVKRFEKLLAGGIWCIVTIDYYFDENALKDSPFIIESLKPIQMPNMDMEAFKEARKGFELSEWMDLLIRSTGMEPTNLDESVKWHLVERLVPFVENNYNVCELGPRGTGKSYVYKELSPNSILISGGQTTVANLFYNMARRTVGLVGMWDVVAFDEVAGIRFKDKDGIQIMKDYMESGSFARGKEQIQAKASMVFVGNIDGSIENIVRTSHLLSPFPKEMIDTAFFDRFHYYIPGWEVPKMRPEFFTNEYGFITDYMAEWMRELQKENFSDAIERWFRFGKDLNQRDVKAVKKTVSGLLKLLFPDGSFAKEDVETVLRYAMVGRRRIKEQLKKIGGMEFYDVHFSYIDLENGEERFVTVPESGGNALIPEGELPPGTLYAVASSEVSGHKGLFRIDLQKMAGSGKVTHTGFGSGKTIKDEIKEAINYAQANLHRVSAGAKFKEHDFHIKATDLNGIENVRGLELAIFLSIASGVIERPLLPQMTVLGSMSIGGSIIGTDNLGDALQVASDAGAKRVLIPAADMAQIAQVPADLMAKFQLLIYNDPVDAVFKATGV
ncbi:protease Lon-related BREX system protein BrxL [Hydrogenimonas cancrithermarum]|uniref:ATP-dependent Lon protease n=1 Tax=Hydrogenimonas cancrithermarum TaxID=2993563 RepID=A0ABN6WW14_9BACT|nr:protease Lon-related BREX system protein BrxL [Hydrogenimonas cancrithermarum]BDY12482.1 ATP-dependent Lon protease [Hydrogenimonas cancrithermarum]